MGETLKTHEYILANKDILLRPMSENDWDILLKWNSDAEVLYYCEGDEVDCYNLAQIQDIYRFVSLSALCFIIEYKGMPIGECWLQKMNLAYVIKKFPDYDSRRIDLMIGEKEFWCRGIGTEVLRMLVRFGFEVQKADIIFGCDIADYNVRSFKAFQKAGFEVYSKIAQLPGNKAVYRYYLKLTKERYKELCFIK